MGLGRVRIKDGEKHRIMRVKGVHSWNIGRLGLLFLVRISSSGRNCDPVGILRPLLGPFETMSTDIFTAPSVGMDLRRTAGAACLQGML